MCQQKVFEGLVISQIGGVGLPRGTFRVRVGAEVPSLSPGIEEQKSIEY